MILISSLVASLLICSPESEILTLSRIRSHHSEEEGNNKIADIIRDRLEKIGFTTMWDYSKKSFTAERRPRNTQFTALLVGHMDTAYPPSTAYVAPQLIPYSRDFPMGPAILGPGALDAKAGIVQMLHVIDRMENYEAASQIHWKIFIQADEEIFSMYSRDSLQEFSRGADIGLVFEFAWYDFSNDRYILPTQVGGNLEISLVVGRTTNHSGVSAELGRNANDIAVEVATAFQSYRTQGVSVRILGIEAQDAMGGQSTLKMRLRYSTAQQRSSFENRLIELNQRYKNETTTFDYSLHDIWEPHDLRISRELVQIFKSTSIELGLAEPLESLTRTHDAASFISQIGVPVLTSMGLPGQHSHSPREIVFLKDFERRTKLSCEIILKLLAR